MILVDTSVWINHLRVPSKILAQLLDLEQVLVHPFVVGELSCGNLVNRKEIIALLHSLPTAPKAADDEILFFIERHRLMGRGLGLVDMHLLASATIAGDSIWTADKGLRLAAAHLGIEFGRLLASSHRAQPEPTTLGTETGRLRLARSRSSSGAARDNSKTHSSSSSASGRRRQDPRWTSSFSI